MRCHEVLGIDERATVSDIMLAYENKKTSLTDEHTSVSAEQIQAKLCELNSAKDNCIAWTNMDFASKNGKPRKRVFCGLLFSESS
ncbi:MAG: hypothetical protein ACLUYZ_10060 [Lachnospiraceae bacterium]